MNTCPAQGLSDQAVRSGWTGRNQGPYPGAQAGSLVSRLSHGGITVNLLMFTLNLHHCRLEESREMMVLSGQCKVAVSERWSLWGMVSTRWSSKRCQCVVVSVRWSV